MSLVNSRKIQLVVLIALATLIASTCVFTVDETQRAVITRFGKPLNDLRKPGLNFKWPWFVDQAIPVDVRHLIVKVEPLEMLTDDKKNVMVEGFLIWQIHDPKRYVETVKTRELAEERLRDLYSARLGATVGNLPMESFISVGLNKIQFHDVSEQIRHRINDISFDHFGIRVIDIHISGFSLPTQNRASIIARMNAERARIASRYRSEGAEQALKIEAKAAAEHERIMANAHAEATVILGKADADALKILAEAYTKDPEFYRFLRSLDSYEAIIGEDTTLFLESDSKLLKVLNGDGL